MFYLTLKSSGLTGQSVCYEIRLVKISVGWGVGLLSFGVLIKSSGWGVSAQ
jgi:hypothetical protein